MTELIDLLAGMRTIPSSRPAFEGVPRRCEAQVRFPFEHLAARAVPEDAFKIQRMMFSRYR